MSLVRIIGFVEKVHQSTEAPPEPDLKNEKPKQRNALTPTCVPKPLEEGFCRTR